ncbi:hypothetical protein GCM10010387_43850 [Streptomyces inusitatus]|uniref:Uncharacterized protein n=2 Tax=Streptomyces inusitatus TaxID=68221 RepID=A0A918QER3_9ACTN|nr:hypothetical protein GCM10010387_43850 [Streptomyces inusitatus]
MASAADTRPTPIPRFCGPVASSTRTPGADGWGRGEPDSPLQDGSTRMAINLRGMTLGFSNGEVTPPPVHPDVESVTLAPGESVTFQGPNGETTTITNDRDKD